jgi:hypothetical protein
MVGEGDPFDEGNELLLRFEYPVTVEIRRPSFEPLASLEFLDVEALSSGSHEIEIGSFDAGRCRRMARAIIRDGMVTGIEVEPCPDGEAPAPELAALLVREARDRLGSKPDWTPVPVAELARDESLIDIGRNGPCFTICFGLSILQQRCTLCCWDKDGKLKCAELGGYFTGPLR